MNNLCIVLFKDNFHFQPLQNSITGITLLEHVYTV